MKVTRDQVSSKYHWGRIPDNVGYVIYSPSGWVYDTYTDRESAMRVLRGLSRRYGDGYTMAEIV